MFVVSNRIPVATGHEDAFAERFRSRAGLVEGHAGFLRLHILRPTELDMHGQRMGRSLYHIVLTYWDCVEDFVAWTNSEDFKTAHSDRPPAEMFSGENVFELHEVIQSAEPMAST
ncbi:MAG: antibiotic biosynthesis monooxygenase [Acidobacteriota bacterium]|nr:antibiotic biosynthesis monooxygenase [Acidobacteriota bacterium]